MVLTSPRLQTALKTGDGRIVKARGPSVGHCVVMQGREINHAALKAYNVEERITMVTSFRAKDPMLNDGSGESLLRCLQWNEVADLFRTAPCSPRDNLSDH